MRGGDIAVLSLDDENSVVSLQWAASDTNADVDIQRLKWKALWSLEF